MRSLNRLLKLHLISHQHQILRTPRNGNGICQRKLARFVNEQEIQLVIPFRSGKKPCGSANDAAFECCTAIRIARNVF